MINDNTDHNDEESKPCEYRRNEWLRQPLQIYLAIVATAILLLQVYHLLYLGNSMETSLPASSKSLIQTRFDKDLRYMSLDREFDHLWQFGNTSTLRVADPVLATGEDTDAAVAM